MRVKRLVTASAIGGLFALGIAAPSQASLTTFCDGVAEDVSVPGDLVVASGDNCELTNVTIDGDVTVRADATILLEDSSVAGALRVRDNGFANVVETDIQGATRLNEAFGVYSENSAHERNVVGNDSEFYYTLGSSHSRNVNVTNVETFLETSWVERGVEADGGLLVDVYDSVIEGAVSIAGTEMGSVFCLSEVDGDATFTGNDELLQIGGDSPVSDCGFNVFGGSLTMTGNTADASITGNVIRGDLVCSDNSPAPIIEDNRVRGERNCETGNPVVLSSPMRSGDVEAFETRKDEVLDEIDDRIADGEKSAAAAGHAFD
ncbi:hypothetical protein EF847_13195 [Actinobacteria bacterium YIM 96077]|uniref:Right handed beta helix domain-containing protein n=1 Tax=Phytoactinopolyspora halophila TaxID=1981511 RepID=A0A329QL65_9ACTN|nr:hypothetical protein [Phytoactinopolyspora halophila]AYY13506.1 hypothetical protein EF847_13195 [Actinobacteria bacterium YIM 96077]RAW12439.1 hypothetical protein DPM12_14850 [Phytoactinopolyspora halophila]